MTRPFSVSEKRKKKNSKANVLCGILPLMYGLFCPHLMYAVRCTLYAPTLHVRPLDSSLTHLTHAFAYTDLIDYLACLVQSSFSIFSYLVLLAPVEFNPILFQLTLSSWIKHLSIISNTHDKISMR